jgi:hypothetical protein
MPNTFGPIALLGSGETSLAGGRVFESIAQKLPRPLRIAILETPAGFELNSSQVAGRVGEYMQTRLRNFDPVIDIIPARKLETPFSPDEPSVLTPLLTANLIFMGPGSPTYAVRQLKGTLAWEIVRARQRQGAALVFASAATISIGAWALPVYEVYKVGLDIHIVPGLDLFADFGLPLSCIPHWNNTDGGEDVDTSRCFVGLDRFKQWCDMLPPDHTTIGLDEHTGLIIDFSAGKCFISGVSSVSLLRECDPEIYPAGAEFPLSELGEVRWPKTSGTGISQVALDLISNASVDTDGQIPPEVLQLLKERRQARERKDWAASDHLRGQIADLGWQVQDTSAEQVLVRSKSAKRS